MSVTQIAISRRIYAKIFKAFKDVDCIYNDVADWSTYHPTGITNYSIKVTGDWRVQLLFDDGSDLKYLSFNGVKDKYPIKNMVFNTNNITITDKIGDRYVLKVTNELLQD